MPDFIPVDFDPFVETKPIEKITFTNESQREIWLSCMIGGNDANLSYNESVSLEIKGNLNFNALKKAINNLVLRHEALRATISPNGEMLIIYKDVPVELNLEDLSDLNDSEKKENIATFLQKKLNTPLDLIEGPLFKVFLHKIAAGQYYFTILKHHIIGDGWSTGVMLEDLSKMYNADIKGNELLLQPAAQLSDYASAQASFKKSTAYQQTEAYWLDLYKDNVPQLELPVDYPRIAPRSYQGSRFDHPLSKDLVNQLKAVGAKAGASLVTTLLAAFELFLYSETGQNDIVVGLPASGQSAMGLYDVVGHCVNLLPLKSHINPPVSFTDHLKKRKKEVLDAYDHQRLTFGELIKKLYIKRDASRITLVPVMFNIDMGMDNAVAFEGLNFKLISNPRAYEHFELYLNATGSKDGITLEWSYNTSLFKHETIEKFNHHYDAILQAIIKNPADALWALAGAQEPAHTAGVRLNEACITITQTLNTLFDQAVKKYFNKTAVSFNHSSLSYLQLNDQAGRLAAFLIEKGIGPGDIVALLVNRSIDMLVCLLAVLKSGAAYLPIDPHYPVERISFMLDDSAAKVLLLSGSFKNRHQTRAHQIVIDEIWPELDHYHQPLLKKEINGNDLAYVMYTSGSTGKPKGVKISHRNLANFLISMQAAPGITDTDRLLAVTTISFDIAGLELYLPIISGSELVIADSDAVIDGRLLLNIIEDKNITMMQATPSTWQMLIDSGWQKSYPLKVLSGGEALPKELADKLLHLSTEVWNMYGPTETTIWSTIKQLLPQDKLLTIGLPINNTRVYIMDEEGKQLPDNETGEINIGGEGVAEGYLNRPELNAEKFVNDSFGITPGSKLYRTGDLGKILPNGEVQCLGRIDHQVKIRGHRIELDEIESIMAKQQGVKRAVVLAREDSPVDKRLIAYVTLNNEADKTGNPSWKDRWDMLYETGAEEKQNLAVTDQNIDGTLLEHLKNSEDLTLQAAEWLQTSVNRIKKLQARRIYEIGSGAGQLLFELAPGVDYYMATDYAQAAILNINRHLQADNQKWKHVKASVAAADDFSALGNTPVDLVLIHSVAQYFPDAGYLLSVIKQSVKAVKQGGCIFIGDMQGKNSLKMFHAMDYLPRAAGSGSIASFNEVVANRVRIEEEFVADPAFFYLLPKHFPEITAVDVQLRKGQSVNEITKYHYDVWLYVTTPVAIAKIQAVYNWQAIETLTELENILKKQPGSVIEIKSIPNARTVKDHQLLQILNTFNPLTLISAVKSEIEQATGGIHPDQLWALGDNFNYNAHLRWTTDGTDGLFDAVFVPVSRQQFVPPYPPEAAFNMDIDAFAKAPVFKNELHLDAHLVKSWIENLSKFLPAYMVPEEFIALKGFPLTPNAKIDRNALPKPPVKKTRNSTNGNRALTPHEQLVTTTWTEVLGLENLTPADDFFQLGGHSLLAVKVMVAIEKKTGKRLPLATLFSNPTIEKLAKQLSDTEPEEIWDCIVPIKTTGTKPPLFLIHGSGLNVLMFKAISEYFDNDQPIYGIQAIGLGKPAAVPSTVEEIAAYHIHEIARVNPYGPYAVAGYSYGGFIAYEIARQLIQAGKEVKLLGMIDTNAGNLTQPKNKLSNLSKKVRRQFYKLPYFVNSFIKYPDEALAYQHKRMGERFSKLFLDNTAKVEEGYSLFEQQTREKYDVLISKYTLIPMDVVISLFRVEKRLYFIDDRKYLGWHKFALKGIDVYEIPGDHKTFLEPPYNKKAASIIQQALNK